MKKRVVLHIDSKEQNKTKVSLEIDGRRDVISQTTSTWTSQVLLPLIDKILKKNKLKIFDVSEIKAEKGPGSFTGVRVGVTVANALGFLLGIPVNSKRNKIIKPIYSR